MVRNGPCVIEDSLYDGRSKNKSSYCQILPPWQNSGYKRQSLIWEFNQIASTKDSSCCYISLDKIIGTINSYALGHKLITSWGQEEISPMAGLHSYIHYKRINNSPQDIWRDSLPNKYKYTTCTHADTQARAHRD